MNYNECIENARDRVGKICKACPECNGRACGNKMPGPGSKGIGDTAIRNYNKWKEIRVQMDTLAEKRPIDTSLNLFGKTFKYPFFAGPVGAVNLHYGDSLNDVSYNDILVSACAEFGIAAFTGDGTDSNVMAAATKAIKNAGGFGIPTVKPWNIETIREKMALVHDAHPFAVAMDIDAAGLPFLQNLNPPAGSKSVEELRAIREAAGVPFTLPRSKYWYRNDYVPVYERVNRPVEAREAIEFFASDDQRTKVQLSDGSSSDYLPSKTLMLPVDKQNVLRSGIVAEKDKDLIVDTVYIKLSGDYLNKGELMIVDMLSNYDWTRPIYLTQPYIFQKFGLVDYLQFDGYAYRFVPILTPYRQAGEVGRIDPEYAVPLLLDVFRYGNLDDEKVYSDYFTQYNLSAARAREAFARVAKELIRRGDEKPNFPDSLGITEATNRELAIRLLDEGMRRMPPAQVRYTSNNTLPFIEAYYAAGAADKGDALMLDYARNLMEYVDYYFQFDGWQYDSITDALDEKLDLLGNLYSMAGYLKRDAVLTELNAYYRSLGVTEEELIQPDSAHLDYEVSDTAAVN